MISIIRNSAILALVGSLLLPVDARAQDSPHWNKATCDVCHLEAAPSAGAVNLRETDAESLCDSCHGSRGEALPCGHSSGIDVGDVQIPEALRGSLRNGQVVCATCHDVVYQCDNPRVHYSYENPGFLRERTSRKRGQYCLQCHDAPAYAKLNPHDRVAGTERRPTCMLCHEHMPVSTATGGISAPLNMKQDVNVTCRGCHNVKPHPIDLFSPSPSDEWIHLVVPSAKVLAAMQSAERDSGLVLPLNRQTGEVVCTTCHDEHGFDQFGAGEKTPKHRLRATEICRVCHEK